MLFLRMSALLALATVGLFLGVRFLERTLTYRPPAYSESSPNWIRPANVEEHWIPGPNERKLNAWLFRPVDAPSRGFILYNHGNGGSISGLRDFAGRLVAHGYEIVVWDYPGYGRSEGPLPAGEDELFADAVAVYDFFARQAGKPLNVWGQSLGSIVAADLCSRRPCRALVMESGLSSARHYAETRLPWIPSILHVFVKNRFESAQKLSRVQCPLLIAHGMEDRTIPDSHALVLFANAASDPKNLLLVPGGTHWLPGSAGYLDQVRAFLDDPGRPQQKLR
jgi:alpha-beta hydrolase superfamily lysophospholipase